MKLGVFSLSLAVKDIKASKAFYEKLGFTEIGGNLEHGYLILSNTDATIGLFQGMFDKNILTFNPGWGAGGAELAEFEDIRSIQKRLRAEGVAFDIEADEDGTGPASFTLQDPDGNAILVDQHR